VPSLGNVGECASRGRSHPGIFVVHQRDNGVNGRSNPMSGNDLGAHLANAPMSVRRGGDYRFGGAVVPDVQESTCGPDSWPVTLDATNAICEDDIGHWPTEHPEELRINGFRFEKRDAIVDDG
jgi:hypothetical protein